MNAAEASPASPQDRLECDREPIHIPGSIQPHGLLFTLREPGLDVAQASANTNDWLGQPALRLAGRSLTDLFGPEQGATLESSVRSTSISSNPTLLRTVRLTNAAGHRQAFHAIAHRHAGVLFLELEPVGDSADQPFYSQYPVVREFMRNIQSASGVTALAQLSADEVRRISGFDRVLVYKFDSEWNGRVIAESQEDSYPSYLDLWFPASDIPKQARLLYQANRIRLIADAEYHAVPILPAGHPSGEGALDLSFSVLRSVSPIHLEYLRNMGVAASMSLSILTEGGRLWGLIACHHRTPLMVPIEARMACDFLVQAFSVQLESIEQRGEYQRRIALKTLTTQLLALMAREDDFTQAFRQNPDELIRYLSASGAAVLHEGKCLLLGRTPTEAQVREIAEFLSSGPSTESYQTDCLSASVPAAEEYRDVASGLCAVSISKLHSSFLLWFRSEVVRTVQWAGDPRKPLEPGPDGAPRLHPRHSFEIWKQTVRGRSLPWLPAEVEAVAELRNAVIGIVLRRAEELAQLTAELQRSNKELESFSYSISHDLRAPFRHVAGYAELLLQSPTAKLGETDQRYVSTIIKSAQFAGLLVDKLLSFSQVARAQIQPRRLDSNALARDVQKEEEFGLADSRIEWRIGPLPNVEADPVMLRLVWQNLLQNAIKYSRHRDRPIIEIGAEARPHETIFHVRDNGVGFDQRYADKLFGVFQRLHRMEDFEGTGIGLANVRRMVERHGGRTWAEGKVDQGAVFYFSLPENPFPEGR